MLHKGLLSEAKITQVFPPAIVGSKADKRPKANYSHRKKILATPISYGTERLKMRCSHWIHTTKKLLKFIRTTRCNTHNDLCLIVLPFRHWLCSPCCMSSSTNCDFGLRAFPLYDKGFLTPIKGSAFAPDP